LQLRGEKEFEVKQWVEVLNKHVSIQSQSKNDTEQEWTGEWTAAKTIEMMNRGQKMTAYFANGDRRAIRMFCRSLCVYVCHVNGTPNQPILQIALREVTDIYVGKQTPGFATSTSSTVPPEKCFSIKSKQYTIDAEATTPHQTLGWLKGLQYLLTNSGKSVLYDEEEGGLKKSTSKVDLMIPPSEDQDKDEGPVDLNKGGDQDSAPPPLQPDNARQASSPSSLQKKKRKNKQSPASDLPSNPVSPVSPSSEINSQNSFHSSSLPSPYSPVSLSPDSAQEDEDIKELMERFRAVERERDNLKQKCEMLIKQTNPKSPTSPQPSGGAASESLSSVVPSLAVILEKYRTITVDPLARVVANYAMILAAVKNKKLANRHHRKAGLTMARLMQESWERTNSVYHSLISKTISSLPYLENKKNSNSSTYPQDYEKYISKLVKQLITFINPEITPFPMNGILNETLQLLGKLHNNEVEKTIKEFFSQLIQLWVWLLLTKEDNIVPHWKEELTSEFYILSNDVRIKDGTVRYPPLVSNHGDVVCKGEARAPRKGGSKARH